MATDVKGVQIVIAEDAREEEIILEGNFEKVGIKAEGTKITAQGQTTINELIVIETAIDTKIELAKGTVISKMVFQAKTDVQGEGTIERAEINADGVNLEIEAKHLDIAPGVKFIAVKEKQRASTHRNNSISKSNAKEITSFNLAGLDPEVIGVINQDTREIVLMVPLKTNIAELIPTIEVSPKATVNPSSGVTQDFTYSQIYEVTAENNSKVNYTVIVTKEALPEEPPEEPSEEPEDSEEKEPKMSVNPKQVDTASYFEEYFTLILANDTVAETVYAQDIRLGGVFEFFDIKDVTRDNANTVTAEVYGNNLKAGKGVIILDSNVLELSKDNLNVEVAVIEKVEDLVEADLTAYNAALSAVEEIDYTPESWATYQAVVIDNVVTVANTQEEVDKATVAILVAQAELVFAGQSDLNKAKRDVTALNEEDYTVKSWTVLINALALSEARNAEIVAKTIAINEAIAGLEVVRVADVANLEELELALINENILNINITTDILNITESIVIDREVTINGAGNKLIFEGLEALTDTDNENAGLIITKEARIKNLIVDAGLIDRNKWGGIYSIHVLDTVSILNNITTTGGNGGILVNCSTVVLEGTIDVSNNGFVGIKISAGEEEIGTSSLRVTDAELYNTTEVYGLPTIWEETCSDRVIGGTFTKIIKDGKTQYYLLDSNSQAPEIAVTGVTLDKTTLDLTVGKETGILVATVSPDNATNKNLIWSSSDTSIATVIDGVVTPKSAGTVTITVTNENGNFTANCLVTVNVVDILGSGTELDPFIIYTLSGLEKIGTEGYPLNAYYRLGQDIDASSTSEYAYNLGKGWKPIGEKFYNFFTGTFDGYDHKINNLRINRTNEDYVGLFRNLTGTVRNLHLENVNIGGSHQVGSVTGALSADSASIYKVTVTGSVTGIGTSKNRDAVVGGLVGMASKGSITNCNSSAAINLNVIDCNNVGGLVGRNTGVSIINSSATGVVNGNSNIGGLVGSYASNNIPSTISNSYATGTVSGISSVGGLVGELLYVDSKVKNSYATGVVTGENNVGGLVGELGEGTMAGGSILDNYALNPSLTRVPGSSDIEFGRITGNSGNLSNNYANRDMNEPYAGAFNAKTANEKDGGDIKSWSINEDGELTVVIANQE